MPIEYMEQAGSNVLHVKVTGTLQESDYEQFVPVVEGIIKTHGKVRVLVEMTDFEGWDFKGLWEDIKFDAKHFNDIERVAMVGEEKWQKWMTSFCKPFTTAEVRFFPPDQLEEAKAWVEGAVPSAK